MFAPLSIRRPGRRSDTLPDDVRSYTPSPLAARNALRMFDVVVTAGIGSLLGHWSALHVLRVRFISKLAQVLKADCYQQSREHPLIDALHLRTGIPLSNRF